MRVVVTGAMGFIGRHLLVRLREDHEVFALARDQDLVDVPDGVETIAQDLSEPLVLERLPRQVDAVVHLAQSDFYHAFPKRVEDMVAVNVASTVRLLDYARTAGARCFLSASTGGVYGRAERPFVETDPADSADFYAATRRAAELLTFSYSKLLRTVVFRFFFVYGPGQQGMLVPTLMERLVKGEEVTVQGNPGLRISPTHVSDAVRAIEAALLGDASGVFNVAGDEATTITQLVEIMSAVAGVEARIVHVEGDTGGIVGDNGRMKRDLGIVPEVSLREGLVQVASEIAARVAATDEEAGTSG